MLMPIYDDMDEDLVNEWCQSTEGCSFKLMKTLTKHSKQKMELQMVKIEMIMKELEKSKDAENVKDLLNKMEKFLQKYEEEIMERKTRKFTRDRLDYQHVRVYIFAKKYDGLSSKEKLEKSKSPLLSESDISLVPGFSADEVTVEKMDFQRKLRLIHMTI
ncbi:hypothetical protein NDU88_007435 [Pleurodeles waltl]|uniref:Uncharacterized protein n=1 Tax=Pleurodeles waltl TaxID=8319 RepID=A0AAV7N5C3_PLEWA|nr:hypothetical protein NDU88_007435 [Pleurodeles waltl]